MPAWGAEWIDLFDGKSLHGWEASPGGEWAVENGVLRGKCEPSEKRHGILLWKEPLRNFTVEIEYRANEGNSGLYIRTERVDHPVAVTGFQAEMDATGKHAGGLYETQGRAWVVQPSLETIEEAFRPGDWNVMRVSAQGPQIVVSVNGVQTAELRDEGQDPSEGYREEGFLGLQLHGGQTMDIEVKSVKLKKTASVIPEGAEVRKLAEGFTFVEGPAEGPDGRLYFNDIPNETTHVYDPSTGETEVWRTETGRANGLWWAPDGKLLACEGGNRRITAQDGAEFAVIAETVGGKKLNSPNDLVMDVEGGIYFTDPRYGKQGGERELEKESVYYVPPGGEVALATDHVTKPNGIIMSPDKKILYVADPGEKTIWSFPVLGPGKLGERSFFAATGSDGMTVDVDGNVYCTSLGVSVWSPEGELISDLVCPERPANCAFGGEENRTLYITARTSLYAIDLKLAGAK